MQGSSKYYFFFQSKDRIDKATKNKSCYKHNWVNSKSISLPYEAIHKTVQCKRGTSVAHRLRRCATNGKVAVSIPANASGYFIDIKSFQSHYGPGVDSASNRNEYQEYFLGVKAAGV